MRTGLIGKYKRTTGTQVSIPLADCGLIVGSEIVANHKRTVLKGELQFCIAVIPPAGSGVERPVSSREIHIASRVGSGPGIGGPDSTFATIRRDIKHGLLCKCRCIVR